MTSVFTAEHTLFGDSVRAYVEKNINPFVNLWEENKNFPSEIFKELGQAGYLGILIDEQWNGVGLDRIYAAKWCEEFGRVRALGFTTAVNMHSLVISPTVQRFGTEKVKDEWLKRCVSGEAIGAYAFTEPNAGSDLSQIQTKAVKDGSDYILTGTKIFITNGARADYVLVLAKTDPQAGYKGFTTFLVDTKSPGFSVARTLDKLGWHSSDTAELVFDGVRVPETNVLGQVGEGWNQAMSSLEWERLMLSLLSIAGASQCLQDTVAYVKERVVFKKKVGDFPINRELLAAMQVKIESARSLSYLCLSKLISGQSPRKEVCALKAFICEEAFQIAHECLQMYGGYGYTTEFGAERWLRDLRLNTIGGGTTQIMERSIARDLLQ